MIFIYRRTLIKRLIGVNSFRVPLPNIIDYAIRGRKIETSKTLLTE
jgi:hypothetical protein